jgi:hypothetical protein
MKPYVLTISRRAWWMTRWSVSDDNKVESDEEELFDEVLASVVNSKLDNNLLISKTDLFKAIRDA